MKSAAASVRGVSSVSVIGPKDNGGSEYIIKAEGDLRLEISTAVSAAGGTIIEMKTNELSLEDIFIKLTGEGGKADESDI